MTSFSGYRITAQAIQLCRKVVSLPASGAYVGEPVVVESTGRVYEWTGSSWSDKGQAAPSSGGGGGSGNVEGGDASSIYGGTSPVDGGAA